MRRPVIGLLLIVLAGCSAGERGEAGLAEPVLASVGEARASLAAMRAEPAELPRPVIVIDGFLDPGFGSAAVQRDVERAAGSARVATASWGSPPTIEAYARRVEALARAEFPGEAVDLVGISMGGLVAVEVAAAGEVEVVRVFTLASPLRGADRANLPAVFPVMRQMRPGSDYIRSLPAKVQSFLDSGGELVSYGGVGDRTVRLVESVPPTGELHWLPADGSARWGHTGVIRDPRLVGDLIARLRGEPGLIPARPLPEERGN